MKLSLYRGQLGQKTNATRVCHDIGWFKRALRCDKDMLDGAIREQPDTARLSISALVRIRGDMADLIATSADARRAGLSVSPQLRDLADRIQRATLEAQERIRVSRNPREKEVRFTLNRLEDDIRDVVILTDSMCVPGLKRE